MKLSQFSIPSTKGHLVQGELHQVSQDKFTLVCVHGSFLQDRHGSIDSTHPWMWSGEGPSRDLFSRLVPLVGKMGGSVFLYDKRGCKAPPSVFEESTVNDFANDLKAVCSELKERSQSPVVVLAHSEGALTTTLAFLKGAQIDAVLFQNGMGVPLDELLEYQKDRFAKTAQSPEVKAASPFLHSLYTQLYNNSRILSDVRKNRQSKLDFDFEDLGKLCLNTDFLKEYHFFTAWNAADCLDIPKAYLHAEDDSNCPEPPALCGNCLGGLDHAMHGAGESDYLHAVDASLKELLEALRASVPPEDKTLRCVAAGPEDLADVLGFTEDHYSSSGSFVLPEGFELTAKHLAESDLLKSPFVWKLTSAGQTLGFACHYTSLRNNVVHFTMGLLPEFQGQDVGLTAAKKIVEQICSICRVHKIEAGANADNKASIKILQQLGFREKSVQKDSKIVGGQHAFVYRCLPLHEWGR